MTYGLFKYFSTDQDKLERFTNGQIYLTPPKFLNDPWEFLLRCDPPTEEQLSNFAPPEGLAEFRRSTASADFLEKGARKQREELSRRYGIVCLTEKPLDRLMWAHYGESHRGFVAEFRHRDDETKSDFGFRLCGSPFGAALKVEYRQTHPNLRNDQSNMEEVVLTKQNCWAYEEEWRVIQPLNTGQATPQAQGLRPGFVQAERPPPSDLWTPDLSKN